jgi:hypothetical protein
MSPFFVLLLRRRMIAGIVTLGALAIGLSACGGSGTSTAASGSTGAQYQARLNFAKCMRSHGLDVPDPSTGGGPAGGGGAFRRLNQYPRAQVQTALQACNKYLRQAFGNDNASPAQRAARRQQLVKFAQCMRSHGINIPDPVQGQGGGGFGFRQTLRSLDTNSPAFKSALSACQSLAPRFGNRGGGGAGASGPPPPGV